MVALVVTDLDGSLWDHEARIHPATRAALAELDARAVPWIVATGRRHRTTREALAVYDLAPNAVLLDGAMGRDLATGAWFHRRTFDVAGATAVLAAFTAHGLSPCVYLEDDHVDFAVSATPSTHPEHVRRAGRWAVTGDLEEVVATGEVLGFSIAGRKPEELALVVPAIEATGVAHAVVTRDLAFGGGTLMVRARGTSKWEGVAAYCAVAGLDERGVLAVGDGENDLELLAGAAVACVVADACEQALDAADHVIPPASEGGWAEILALLESSR